MVCMRRQINEESFISRDDMESLSSFMSLAHWVKIEAVLQGVDRNSKFCINKMKTLCSTPSESFLSNKIIFSERDLQRAYHEKCLEPPLDETGQPKWHLLTTGWSVFVSAKRLGTGDFVLFIWANWAQTAMPFSLLSSDSMHIGLLALLLMLFR